MGLEMKRLGRLEVLAGESDLVGERLRDSVECSWTPSGTVHTVSQMPTAPTTGLTMVQKHGRTQGKV